MPDDGVNAVTHLGRLLARIETHDAVLRARPPHPLVGNGSLMATVARGGQAPFSLAARAEAVVERRTLPGETAAVALDEVSQLLAEMRRADPTVSATWEVVVTRESWQSDDSSAAIRLGDLLRREIVATGRREPEDVGAPYWMESALWAAADVPAVVCGPAGGGLHSDHEWGDVGEIGDYAVALSAAIRTFCGVIARS
jgi:acetylornithine deacetylase